ncbi:MAG: ABC transporter permease [Pseudohongiellaceae bacterium]
MSNTSWTLAWRNLLKHKTFVVINITGLAVAIASSIVILLYARFELDYDRFHQNADRIHLVVKERNTATGVQNLQDTWIPLLSLMRQQYGEIESGARVYEGTSWVEAANQKYLETITYADPTLFSVFSFPLAQGDENTALEGVNSLVLSAPMARKYFGDENPIGQRLTLNFTDDFVVTGVLEQVPQNSSLRPDFIIPIASAIAPDDEQAYSNWTNSFLFTYLLLEEGADAGDLEAKLPDLVLSQFGTEGANGTNNMNFRLWSLPSLQDREEGSHTTAYILLAIAFSIILIACVNFTNLATARAMERSKEVGVRKTFGALRGQLVRQFLGESMLISAIAIVLGLWLAGLLLPVFNALYGLDLQLNPTRDLAILSLLVGVGILAGLLSGGYPAFFLSNFKTVESLKGRLQSSRHGVRLRNSLSVIQFSFAIALVIAVTVIWQQVRHMKTVDLHFDPEQVLIIETSLRDFADAEIGFTRIQTFKNAVLQIPGVESIASSMSVPGNFANANIFATPEGWQRDEPLRTLVAGADDFYFETFGMEFIEGRNFSRDFATETSSVILNESAMRAMEWDTAVGKRVNDWTVVGVVSDYHYATLRDEIRPIVHVYGPQESRNHSFLSIKSSTDAVAPVLARIETLWSEMDDSRPFTYHFAEDSMEALYGSFDNVTAIVAYFSLLSIVVANLGLLGLSAYSVVQRTREIGIRKVLGASVAEILFLLSRQFTRPVLLANVVAWPLAWYGMSQWLQGFAYRIELNWLVFIAAGIVVLFLSIATVTAQSARVARSNPVEALRYE